MSADTEPGAHLSGKLWLLVTGYGFFGYGYVVSATFIVAMAQNVAGNAGGEIDSATVWVVVGIANI